MMQVLPKILVTGCGGMLGEAVYNHFKNRAIVIATDKNVNEPWLHNLDVTDYASVREFVYRVNPDYIFHLAALTDMEYCEKNHLDAYKTNAIGSENIALLCKKLDIPMIYISTAGVFDGKKEVYEDYDVPNPLSIYGKSKYAGECSVKSILSKYFVFRPGWMIGGGPDKDKKFINKIIKQIRDGKKVLHVVDDKMGSPTYTYDLARIIEKVIFTCPYGAYNAVCEGGGSRYDIAKEILRIKGLDKKIKVKKVSSQELKKYIKEDYFAPRPYSEQMVNIKLQIRGVDIPRHWKIWLQEYMEKFDWGI